MSAKLIAIFLVSLMGFPTPSVAQTDRFQKLGVDLDDWSEGQIDFWKKVYTQYTTDQAILHDAMNLKRVYDVVPDQPKKIAEAKQEVHQALQSIYEKNKDSKVVEMSELTPEEMKFYNIQETNEDPRSYQFASTMDRIRMQLGQKDRLENAYSISTRYLKRMEEMFIEEGVPKELTRLVFVESGFVNSARSSVGALGIWQFMPQTAMKDLRVTSSIDERRDPLKSTRAAAKYLYSNYKVLKNWSLAIMAYHHGAGLVQKAIDRLKTRDPLVIVKTFKDPNYKFASRNYLFEFLAMLDVDAAHASFFKDLEATALPSYITVSFPQKMFMKDILEHYSLGEGLTRVLNPHFLEPIWMNKEPIPAHYPVRLTGITLEEFQKNQYPGSQ